MVQTNFPDNLEAVIAAFRYFSFTWSSSRTSLWCLPRQIWEGELDGSYWGKLSPDRNKNVGLGTIEIRAPPNHAVV